MRRAPPTRRIGLAAFAGLVAWSVCAARAGAQEGPAVRPLPPAASPAASSWRILAASSEGRAIEFVQFGNGRRHILVLGPLAGDQPAALGMVDKLAEYLAASRAPLPDVTLTLVRDPNPDGRARRSRFNARGVDLDRNFSTSNWQRLPEGNHWRSGLRPHSEPETRVLATLLADLRPDRIVTVTSASDRAALGWSGPGNELVRALAGELELPLVESATQPGGSLAAYAALDRGIAVLAFGVPSGAATLDNWSALGRGLLTAVGVASPEPRRLPVADLAPEPMPGSDSTAPTPFAPRAPRGQGPLRQHASGATRAMPISDGRPAEETREREPAKLPAIAHELPREEGGKNSARALADSLDMGGWRPASRPSAAASGKPETPPAAPSDAIYWPADRIQRLPPADRVDR